MPREPFWPLALTVRDSIMEDRVACKSMDLVLPTLDPASSGNRSVHFRSEIDEESAS